MAHTKLPDVGIDTTLAQPQAPGNFRSTQELRDDSKRWRSLRDIPGTRAAEELRIAGAQLSFGENVVEGFKNATSLYPAWVKFKQEGALGLLPDPFGLRGETDNYDRDDFAKHADPRLDRDQVADIISEVNLPAAQRAHGRYVAEINRAALLNDQAPGSGFSQMIGAFLDVDLPLAFMSGGSYKAAVMTAKMIKMSQKAGLTYKAGERVASFGLGVMAGAQGGLAVAGLEISTKETAGWGDFASILAASTLLGGALGGIANTGKHMHARVANEEFLDRVRRDDPNLTDDPKPLDDIVEGLNMEETNLFAQVADGETVENLFTARDESNLFTAVPDGDDAPNLFSRTDPDTGATVIGGKQPQSLGAAATGTGGRPERTLVDPVGPIPELEAAVIDMADQTRHETGWLEKREANARKLWTKLATSRIGSFGVSDYTRLYLSDSAVLNYLSSHIFESASGLGRGRGTSSVIMDNYHRLIQTHIGDTIHPIMNRWAQEKGTTFLGTGHSITSAGQRAFSRELMLEMNERAMGNLDGKKFGKHVSDAADHYEAAGFTAKNIGKGEAGQRSIDGFEDLPARRGYNPYRWDGSSFDAMLRSGVKMADIEDAVAAGYRKAGMGFGKDAKLVAKAVIQRALARSNDLDGSVLTLMSGDGREFLAQSLRLSGISDAEVDTIMKRLIGDAAERSKEGFAKSRNEIDLSTPIKNANGEDIRIVDLMEQDMHRTWQRYSRQLSGAAALARNNIPNRAARTTFIKAAQAEQRALGEEVMETGLLEAMFSHFNAGPVHGFFDGVTNTGVGQVVAVAKRLANLGLLEKLGITQGGETGAIIAQVGAQNFYTRGVMIAWDKELRNNNKKLLKEVSYLIGATGRDQRYFAEWFDMDDVSAAGKATIMKRISDISANASFVQSYLSAFNHVRAYQQQVAVLGMIDKVMRTLKEGDYDAMLTRFEDDFGLGRLELDQLDSMLNSGQITFHENGSVDVLDLANWDPELRLTFGASMARNMNQVVQKSLAGEQDAWMHTGWGSLMTHLMTFPMQAFQKQFIRNGRHVDLQGLAALSFGMATAMVAVNIRDLESGRDRTQSERAVAAFSYNNMTGWIPMITDPAFTIVGMEDYRINQFGHHASLVPPAFTQADDLRRAPGALLAAARGDMDYYDRRALKALPFAGTYIANRIFE